MGVPSGQIGSASCLPGVLGWAGVEVVPGEAGPDDAGVTPLSPPIPS